MASICGSPVCAGGKPKMKFTYTGDYVVRKDGVVELHSSGTLVFLEPKVIDLFLVGGGGAGGSGVSGGVISGFGGGGGGYSRTVKAVSVGVNTNIPVVIGAGAVPSTSATVPGDGGQSSFGNYTVAGGKSPNRLSATMGNTASAGAAGGSGGGGGRYAVSTGGTGGSDGGDGENATKAGGAGQAYTTREFNEPAGKLYAAGGGGGTFIKAQTAVYALGGTGGGGDGAWSDGASLSQEASAGGANTGGGGGGGARSNTGRNLKGGSGGSGIVCFREAQELPELAGTWVLNERLYATENTLNEIASFTAGSSITNIKTSYVGMNINPSGMLTYLESNTSVYGAAIYKFPTNNWQSLKYKYVTFPTGATASDEFRAWLASNATKQA